MYYDESKKFYEIIQYTLNKSTNFNILIYLLNKDKIDF
jgi:hypothetical protein